MSDTASPWAQEKRTPGLKASCEARGSCEAVKLTLSPCSIQGNPRFGCGILSRFYENMLTQVLLRSLMVHEKVPTEPCWSPSLAILLFFYVNQSHSGKRHTNAQACRIPRLPGLSPILTLPFPLHKSVNYYLVLWSSPGCYGHLTNLCVCVKEHGRSHTWSSVLRKSDGSTV